MQIQNSNTSQNFTVYVNQKKKKELNNWINQTTWSACKYLRYYKIEKNLIC